MRYLFTITFIACGAHAIDMHDTSDNSVVVSQDSVSEKEKFTDEIEQNLAKNSKKENAPRYSQQSIPMVKDKPIPALILPNNVCVINTDLSPDRSIEDHIYACVRAQKIRQSITH